MKTENYEKYRYKWNNYPKLKIVDKMALHIDMELTTRCNLRCIMCLHNFEEIKPQDMDLELAKKIITEFIEKGGCAIKFVYRGEPLLYPYLFEVIHFAKENGLIDARLATNGNLLTEQKSLELINAGLDYLTISIDSCNPDVYKKIRVGGNLKMVISNIIVLQMLKRKLNSRKPHIVVQAVVQDLNKREIKSGEFKQFWLLFVDEVSTINLIHYDQDKVIKSDFFCEGLYQRMTIRVNGDIALCCGQDLDCKILGNAREQSLESIWTSKSFREIRNLMSEGKAHLIPACATCDLRNKYELTNFKRSEWQ